jgi:HlyD family secretion protein
VTRVPWVAAALLLGGACQKAETAPLYEKAPVTRRDIVVTVIADGVIQPRLTLSVKSKAWGQILTMPVQTGSEVRKGDLLATIDPRLARDNLTQAQAALAKAQAQLVNATATLQRADTLYRSHAIAETDYDRARLAFATAQAAVVTATANRQTAQDAMDDTHVRAPVTGTVLEIDAVLGSVISSPTLGGGTVILKMANLDTVQDSAMVAETDIARIRPALEAQVGVDAYPGRRFTGMVAKIGPQAQVSQNVTMFPVFVTIANPGHLLKPGMNTNVTIHTGQRDDVLAIPNAALRTPRDLASAADVLGLDPRTVEAQVTAAAAQPGGARPGEALTGDTSERGGGGAPFTAPGGRTMRPPPGVTPEEMRAVFAKMAAGGPLSAADRALLQRIRAARQGGPGPRPGSGARPGSRPGASYIVFALRGGKPIPVPVTTGLTDQEYIEVTSGLTTRDTVLVLPSASLVQAQQRFRQRFQNVTGGGLPGLRQQQSAGNRAP